MGAGRMRGIARRVLPAVLLLPFVAVSTTALVVFTGGGEQLAVARGTASDVLHPVAGGFKPDGTRLAHCGESSACLAQAFGNLAFRTGPRSALTLFEERIATDPAVEKSCHRIAHVIGSASLARYRGNVARTFAEGSPACVSGYYHGILERAFAGTTSPSRLAEVARRLCVGTGVRRYGFLDYQCRHGLGHGLMIQTGYDLPLSLATCRRLPTEWDRLACAGGAFMENVDTRFGITSPWLDDADPLHPCSEVHARDRRSCYLRATWRMLVSNGFDYAATAWNCTALGRWSRACLLGLGRDVAETARYGAAEILRLCGGVADCVHGAARTVANASGWRGLRPAQALCRQAAQPVRGACFAGVGRVIGLLESTDTRRRERCRTVTSTYEEECTRAAVAEAKPGGAGAWG